MEKRTPAAAATLSKIDRATELVKNLDHNSTPSAHKAVMDHMLDIIRDLEIRLVQAEVAHVLRREGASED